MKTKRRSRRRGKSSLSAQKPTEPQTQQSADAPAEPRNGLSPRARWAISIALLLHLFAVVVPPLAVPPYSQLEDVASRVVRPYVEAFYVSHGYRFFGPDPGPSEMLRAEITAEDGAELPEMVFPDLQEQWPRLLYHRHFMLTSRLVAAPGDAMGGPLAESYARHLHARYHAREVRLYRQRHHMPTIAQVRAGMKLTDESLYETPYASPLGTWRATGGRGGADSSAGALVLEIGDFEATASGALLGRPAPASWTWDFIGPGRMGFQASDRPLRFIATPLEEHELLLRIPLSGGREEAVLLRREPPPLFVYRGERR